MSVKVNTVWVKNKLGTLYGNREIQVNNSPNDQTTGILTISPGEEKSLHPLYQQSEEDSQGVFQLGSLYIEALGLGTNRRIPVSINPPEGLNVDVSCEIEDKRWKITFTPPINSFKTTGSDVNVTLGQDEPLKNLVIAMAAPLFIGLIAAPILYRISPILWAAAVLIALAGAAAAWFRTAGRKREKQESESKETIE
jgi:hypothetical protein